MSYMNVTEIGTVVFGSDFKSGMNPIINIFLKMCNWCPNFIWNLCKIPRKSMLGMCSVSQITVQRFHDYNAEADAGGRAL